eukprot:CAMPEP_0183401824 /NCGR_PEP_ID=MMETSP0370-20130417/13505_1 /TAXON_ID=268820 /ORGANISM="Peridinium aciculiferum, Strain PAER-2" /LENGTH=63 /DNA_ID=CAMNT_0025583319 /DNA_START=62 /DNA_END=250 /DNA_ORIENTATION=-
MFAGTQWLQGYSRLGHGHARACMPLHKNIAVNDDATKQARTCCLKKPPSLYCCQAVTPMFSKV